MKSSICALCVMNLLLIGLCFGLEIREHGYWDGSDAAREHVYDEKLSNAIVQFFKTEKVQTVADFGCGMGNYTRALLKAHIYCEGYDGNPFTPALTGGVGQVADLSQPLNLGKSFDWVLCLEVGEHIPKQYETTFIENLHRHNTKGVVLSWAVKGQQGYGHFNEQDNDYIKSIMAQRGYSNDLRAENFLRAQAHVRWFKNTIMVFRKDWKAE
jgi:2-polyprenyl-3-methyl-5-hydroxy-6-metoxy-1,4-benzoquinol methylase